MEASQPAYRAGAICRDLTSFLIPIQNLISVHMSRILHRRAGPPLGKSHWCTGEISVGGMKIFPHEHSIPVPWVPEPKKVKRKRKKKRDLRSERQKLSVTVRTLQKLLASSKMAFIIFSCSKISSFGKRPQHFLHSSLPDQS